MTHLLGQFATKHPIFSLLICGIFFSVLPVGLGLNMRTLDERDLISDQFRFLLSLLGVLQAVFALTGLTLIGLSIFFAVRRGTTPRAKTAPEKQDVPV